MNQVDKEKKEKKERGMKEERNIEKGMERKRKRKKEGRQKDTMNVNNRKVYSFMMLLLMNDNGCELSNLLTFLDILVIISV
jgi:hypothetical protein